MKIRNGFISNSSSTSFTFCFKGRSIKALINLILTKYQKTFSRSFDEHHCNAWDVANAIEICSSKVDKYSESRFCKINEYIDYLKNKLESIIAQIKNTKNVESYLVKWMNEDKLDLENKIQKLQKAKKIGLNLVYCIEFGDNHGDISGGDLENAMDYDGRYIDIDEKDFVVFTEQNR